MDRGSDNCDRNLLFKPMYKSNLKLTWCTLLQQRIWIDGHNILWQKRYCIYERNMAFLGQSLRGGVVRLNSGMVRRWPAGGQTWHASLTSTKGAVTATEIKRLSGAEEIWWADPQLSEETNTGSPGAGTEGSLWYAGRRSNFTCG